MRPGQNKRMRGRNPNRKGPNPLTRSYESNGPDVKIRGTAHHVAEKYLQLARDAQSSGDPVAAESYLQHAEHYFRLIATAQQAQNQAQGLGRAPGEMDLEDDDDDDFAALPDRFASPVERTPPPPVNPPYAGERSPYNNGGDRQPYNGGERQPYFNGDQQNGNANRNQDRYAQDRPQQGGGERGNGERGYNGPDRQDRGGGGDRPYRNDRDRNNGVNRGPRVPREGGYQGRDQNQRDYQQPRDYQARDPQFREQPSAGPSFPAASAPVPAFEPQPVDTRRDPVHEPQPEPALSEARRPAERPPEGGALPAFITAPARPAPSPSTPEPAPAGQPADAAASDDGFPAAAGGEAFPVRTRRRRRTRAEMEAAQAARSEAPGSK